MTSAIHRTRSALNRTELKILCVLFRREADLLPPPTIRELTELIGVRATSHNWTATALESMKRKGIVTWEGGKMRTLRLTCHLTASAASQEPEPLQG